MPIIIIIIIIIKLFKSVLGNYKGKLLREITKGNS